MASTNPTRRTPHVALLRGVNVGGRNKLPMKQLALLVEAAGGQDVRTYIQSGNVVFSATAEAARLMSKRLSDAIADRLGLSVPVVVRTAAALRKVWRANPFLADGADDSLLCVGFLAAKPSKAAIASLDPQRSPPDALVVRGSDVYLFLPNGAARTKLTNAYLDRRLGTITTVRNWNTVSKLVELSSG